MIQPNELRIGNLFYPINRRGDVHIPETVPFIIKEVSEVQVRGHLYSEPIHRVLRYHDFSIRDISPIPLTPQVLEKCGFEYIAETGGYADEKHIIYQCAKDGEQWFEFHPFCTYDSDCRIIIYHLHQLQNLYFALTGEELEYKP